MLLLVCFFFFQAEDGIRDLYVTGVQTCALPISSSGLHSNGYTLARRALLEEGGLGVHERPRALEGRTVPDALLEPTVTYVRAVLDLLRSDVPVRGLAHITGGGVDNLLRLGPGRLGFAIDAPLPVPAIFGLVQRLGGVSDAEMWEVFNMGCGFVAIVPAERADDAAALLAARHPGAARIGGVTGDAGRVTVAGGGSSRASKISGHHGSRVPLKAVATGASVAGRSSRTRPIAASAARLVPPRYAAPRSVAVRAMSGSAAVGSHVAVVPSQARRRRPAVHRQDACRPAS